MAMVKVIVLSRVRLSPWLTSVRSIRYSMHSICLTSRFHDSPLRGGPLLLSLRILSGANRYTLLLALISTLSIPIGTRKSMGTSCTRTMTATRSAAQWRSQSQSPTSITTPGTTATLTPLVARSQSESRPSLPSHNSSTSNTSPLLKTERSQNSVSDQQTHYV